MGRVVADEAEVLTLAVHPVARRRGVARGLVAAFLAEAEGQGAEAVFLEVAESNAAAIGLYEGAGFATVGRRRSYFLARDGARVDALVMTRRTGGAAGLPEI